MRPPLTVALVCAALALVSFFVFPGHTWLQSDTQIYAPILEHLRDPEVLKNDILVRRPHVSFTVYDEVALGAARVTGLEFKTILQLEQLLARALGIWGAYLTAAALGLPSAASFLVAAIFALGATIGGPTVLTLEYEPVPRGFAVPLMVLAIGLAAHGRDLGAGIAGAAGFLIHPPTVYPFWAVYFLLTLWPSKPEVMRRRIFALVPLMAAVIVLLLASRHQAGAGETQVFFTRLDALQEKLQRWRAPYVWISIWWPAWLAHYAVLYGLSLAAYFRVRRSASLDLRFFLIGLPLLGMLSMAASYYLLEKALWALLPQFQPMRALLFVTLAACLLASVCGAQAALKGRIWEAIPWFAVPYLIPVNMRLWPVRGWNRWAVALSLAAAASLALWLFARSRRWGVAAVAAVCLAAFPAIPHWGKMLNFPQLHSPESDQLAAWARTTTPRDAVFLFPDARRDLDPGLFRAQALRAVYVDWKGGGQVNYLKELGEVWWQRWQATMEPPYRPGNLARFRGLGVDYIVIKPRNREKAVQPVFENSRYVVYRTPQ